MGSDGSGLSGDIVRLTASKLFFSPPFLGRRVHVCNIGSKTEMKRRVKIPEAAEVSLKTTLVAWLLLDISKF